MTEDQLTADEAVDTQRQAELDALAAQLASAASGEPAEAAPKKRASRRVTAKNPSEFAGAEIPGAPEVAAADGAPPAAEADSLESTDGAQPEAADGDGSDAAEGEFGESGDTADESADGEQRSGRSRRGRSRNRNGGGEPRNAEAAPQNQQQARRGRGRGQFDDEPEILEDDVLIPVAGILDVLDNYAFVRTTGYLPGPTDVYVSLGQVKRYGLRKGDAVVGAIRQPREGEQPGRQKYNALVKVDSVNGQSEEQSLARPDFAAATAVRPTAPLGAGHPSVELARGQRALVLGATGSGKTEVISATAAAIGESNGDAHLMVILVGVRPEEVTDFRRSVKGEVVVAALEQSAEETLTVVELAVERAKRLVELGIDVVVLIDGIDQVARAAAALAPASRLGAEDPALVLPAKRLFSAARAIEDGASLTIVAAASEETAIDRLAAVELRAVANALVRL